MAKIMVLDDGMINKIAAGEVVERPGSVVKELVENSIDSGANQIVIEIKDGGIGMIRITDNGSGIGEDEVVSAFMRHATSKIRDMNDLENVLTLGFRGEALSSIAAVSQVEIITKPKNQLMAKRVEIHGGKIVNDSSIGSADGTTLVVRNIFFNTPARRKFLKKAATESSHVSDIVNRIVLAHPEIAFKYIVNNTEIINTNGNGDLKAAVLAVYGKDVAKNLIEVDSNINGIHIKGFVGKPEISRANRTYGSIFINGRYIKSKIIEQAIEESYKTRLMVGKFPVYMLNLLLEPSLIDVNVHPQKMEVRFSDENMVYDAFYSAVTKALANENLIPTVTIVKNDSPFAETAYSIDESEKSVTIEDLSRSAQPENKAKPAYSVDMDNALSSLFNKGGGNEDSHRVNEASILPDYIYNRPSPVEKEVTTEPKVQPFFQHYRIVGQFFNTYWLVEQDNCIYLIDQHAAHERVIFEKLLKEYKNKKVISQKLLDPAILNLSDKEKATLDENIEVFSGFGYEIEHFSDNEYALKAVPFMMKGATDISFFTELLDKLADNSNAVTSIYDEKIDTVATISCKAAVKGNDRLFYAEAKDLIEELLKLEAPFTCPHGRPTIVKLTRYEVEKMFKRV